VVLQVVSASVDLDELIWPGCQVDVNVDMSFKARTAGEGGVWTGLQGGFCSGLLFAVHPCTPLLFCVTAPDGAVYVQSGCCIVSSVLRRQLRAVAYGEGCNRLSPQGLNPLTCLMPSNGFVPCTASGFMMLQSYSVLQLMLLHFTSDGLPHLQLCCVGQTPCRKTASDLRALETEGRPVLSCLHCCVLG